jgi:hypothetical protein
LLDRVYYEKHFLDDKNGMRNLLAEIYSTRLPEIQYDEASAASEDIADRIKRAIQCLLKSKSHAKEHFLSVKSEMLTLFGKIFANRETSTMIQADESTVIDEELRSVIELQTKRVSDCFQRKEVIAFDYENTQEHYAFQFSSSIMYQYLKSIHHMFKGQETIVLTRREGKPMVQDPDIKALIDPRDGIFVRYPNERRKNLQQRLQVLMSLWDMGTKQKYSYLDQALKKATQPYE